MIIFKKLPDGTWQKSGEILPTETHYRIAVDAENPERMIETCAHAIQEVGRWPRSQVGGRIGWPTRRFYAWGF
jgi:hypothetical protein